MSLRGATCPSIFRLDSDRLVASGARRPAGQPVVLRSAGRPAVRSVVSSRASVSPRHRRPWSVAVGNRAEVSPSEVSSSIVREGEGPSPVVADLLSAFDELLAAEGDRALLRRAVRLASERIGLSAARIWLLDASGTRMLGSWRCDLHGGLVDERELVRDISDAEREAFRRVTEQSAHYTVFLSRENAGDPLAVPATPLATLAARWIVLTPIRSSRGPVGMFLNEGGGGGAPFDAEKQAEAALFCSFLGAVLASSAVPRAARSVAAGDAAGVGADGAGAPQRSAVTAAIAMLARDPGLGGKEIATELGISVSQLSRAFRAETGVSLVDYRNRLRLDRFDGMLGHGRPNLLDAALAAGFGSYAQFHRVFRAFRRVTPRAYLEERTRGLA